MGQLTVTNPYKVATTIPKKNDYARFVILFGKHQDVLSQKEILQYVNDNAKHTQFCHVNFGEKNIAFDQELELLGHCYSSSIQTPQEVNQKVGQLISVIKVPPVDETRFIMKCFSSEGLSVFSQMDYIGTLAYGQPFQHWSSLKHVERLHKCEAVVSYINKTAGERCEYTIQVERFEAVKGSKVWHKLAQSQVVKTLNYRVEAATTKEIREDIIQQIKVVALRNQVLSRFTPLVAISAEGNTGPNEAYKTPSRDAGSEFLRNLDLAQVIAEISLMPKSPEEDLNDKNV